LFLLYAEIAPTLENDLSRIVIRVFAFDFMLGRPDYFALQRMNNSEFFCVSAYSGNRALLLESVPRIYY